MKSKKSRVAAPLAPKALMESDVLETNLLPYIFTAKPAKCAKKTFKSLRSSRS